MGGDARPVLVEETARVERCGVGCDGMMIHGGEEAVARPLPGHLSAREIAAR